MGAESFNTEVEIIPFSYTFKNELSKILTEHLKYTENNIPISVGQILIEIFKYYCRGHKINYPEGSTCIGAFLSGIINDMIDQVSKEESISPADRLRFPGHLKEYFIKNIEFCFEQIELSKGMENK